MLRFSLLAAAALTLSACEDTQVCTLVGCIDGVSIAMRRPTSDWGPGAYRLQVSYDGRSMTCNFALPGDIQAPSTAAELKCELGGGLPPPQLPYAVVQQDETCTDVPIGDAGQLTCDPVPNRYSLSVKLYDTPATVSVVLTHQSVLVVESDFMPQYDTHRPNGPECEPTCRAASLQVTIN